MTLPYQRERSSPIRIRSQNIYPGFQQRPKANV